VGGDEREGEPIDFVHPHPDPPPSRGEGIYWENFKYLWLVLISVYIRIISENEPYIFSIENTDDRS
jgi:hypothetical protein